MRKVIVASINPVKLAVAKEAFGLVFSDEEFEFVPISAPSLVPKQPFGDETLVGAMNRLNFIVEECPVADYWVSQEGGLVDDSLGMFNRAWIMVADSEGHIGQSSTPSFELPREVAHLVRGGMELGEANDKFWGTVNSKEGKSGLHRMTEGLIDRHRYYLDAAIIALCQVKNHRLYNTVGE